MSNFFFSFFFFLQAWFSRCGYSTYFHKRHCASKGKSYWKKSWDSNCWIKSIPWLCVDFQYHRWWVPHFLKRFLKVDNDLLEFFLQWLIYTCFLILSVEQQGTTLTTQASQNVPVTQTSSAVAPVLSSMLFMLLLLL